MANPTTHFGWVMPTTTDLVTDLPADFNVFGQGVDTSMQDLLGGTTGQILAKNSATNMDFTWTTPAVSGGMTLISTTSLTGSSVSVAVPSGYKNITYIIQDAVAVTTSGSYLYQTFNSDTNSVYNYVQVQGTAPGTATTNMTTDAKIYLPYINNGSDNNMFVSNTIYDYLNTSTNKSFNGVWNTKNNSAVRVVGNITGTYFPTTPAAITSIQFAWETSNHSSGTVLLYGVN